LNQLIKSRDCQEPAEASAPASLDQLVQLTATFFNTPLAAIFVRAGNGLVLETDIGLKDRISLEILEICSYVIDHNTTVILRDMADQQQVHALPEFRTPSELRFCACLPLSAPGGQTIGTFCIADVEAHPEFSESHTANLRAFSGIAGDLLKNRMAEQNRRAMASALTALGHDIRTPMNGVIGMAELLVSADDLGERHRRRAEVIKQSGATLLTMIEPLFDVAKFEAEEQTIATSPVTIEELLVDVFQFVKDKRTSKISDMELTYNLSSDLVVLADTTKLAKLLSLFVEGLATLGAGAPMRFEAGLETVAGGLKFTLSAAGAEVDGRSLDQLDALLSDKGDGAASNLGGQGLRLIACKQLARMMGGNVVASHLNQDRAHVSVDVMLDLASETDADEEQSSAQTCTAGTQEAKQGCLDVLVAEDDPDMALVIEEFLEDAGYRVTVAQSGATVMKFLDEQAFDIILMDGRLSDMSGLDVTRNIRALPDKRALLPIIALTGDAMAGDRKRYLSAGMNDYLAKPIDCDSLIETINHHTLGPNT
jgi:CheY-like chemotaxis protein